MKKSTIAIIALIIIIAIISAVLYLKKKKEDTNTSTIIVPEQKPETIIHTKKSTVGSTGKPLPNDPFPIKKGDTGDNVKALQEALHLKITNRFDEATYGAVLTKWGTNYYPVKANYITNYIHRGTPKQIETLEGTGGMPFVLGI